MSNVSSVTGAVSHRLRLALHSARLVVFSYSAFLFDGAEGTQADFRRD